MNKTLSQCLLSPLSQIPPPWLHPSIIPTASSISCSPPSLSLWTPVWANHFCSKAFTLALPPNSLFPTGSSTSLGRGWEISHLVAPASARGCLSRNCVVAFESRPQMPPLLPVCHLCLQPSEPSEFRKAGEKGFNAVPSPCQELMIVQDSASSRGGDSQTAPLKSPRGPPQPSFCTLPWVLGGGK